MKKLYHYLPMVILSVFLTVFIGCAEAAYFTRNTLLDPEIYKQAMDQREVSKSMYEELVRYFDSLSSATGIPAEVFTEPLDEEELYRASYRLLKDTLEYLTNPDAPKPAVTYDFSGIERSITDYISKDADERSIKKDKEYEELLNNTVKTAKTQISSRFDTVMLYTLSEKSIGESIHKHIGLISAAFWASVGIAVILLAIMIIIDRHHPRDFIYWGGLVMFVSGAMFLIPSVILCKTGYFDRFFIMNTHIYKTVTGMLELALKEIITVQLVVVIIGFVLLAAAQVVHVLYLKHLKKEYKKTHWHKNTEEEAE